VRLACLPVYLPVVAAWLLLLCAGAVAQTAPEDRSAAQLQPGSETGMVLGVVQDVGGSAVAGAQLTLSLPGEALRAQPRTAVSDAGGVFRFEGVPAGRFTLSVSAQGLAPNSVEGELKAGEHLQMSPLQLRVATVNTEINAISQYQMAEIQIHREETQRLAGILPNYYVVYEHDAQPLTSGQKFELARKTVLDPVNLGLTAAIAGVQQAYDGYSGYGQGAAGYGKRVGAALADFGVGTMLGGYVLPVAFHQDPRYFYKGTGTVLSRIGYAMSTAVIAKGDNGHWQPAYASVLGDFGAGAISNIYYPASNRQGASLTLENGALSVLFDGVGNVIQELVLKHFTPGTPKVAKVALNP